MDAMTSDTTLDLTLTMTRVFAAPPARVWKAWTDKDQVAAWFGPAGVTSDIDTWDFRVGGAYHLVMRETDDDYPLRGTFLEIVEGERLAMTWTWEHGVLDGVEMVVEVDFRAVDGGTEVTLTHTRLPSETAQEKHGEGWTGCFDCLADHLGG